MIGKICLDSFWGCCVVGYRQRNFFVISTIAWRRLHGSDYQLLPLIIFPPPSNSTRLGRLPPHSHVASKPSSIANSRACPELASQMETPRCRIATLERLLSPKSILGTELMMLKHRLWGDAQEYICVLISRMLGRLSCFHSLSLYALIVVVLVGSPTSTHLLTRSLLNSDIRFCLLS